MNKKETSVAVVIVARNEEAFIKKTLSCLEKQTLQPFRIILVNDGSTDSTGKLASQFKGVEVINQPVRTEDFRLRKGLAATINVGLEKLDHDLDCQFIMRLDADHLIPENYISSIISRMNENSNIALASGVIKSEYSTFPRGSGRIIRVSFWKKIGLRCPVNFGLDAYLALKAQSLGYEIKSYPDLVTTTLRETGSGRDAKLFVNRGKALKALGYTVPYTFLMFLILFKKQRLGSFYMLKGYFGKYDDLYEPELRKYVRKIQYQNLFKINKAIKHLRGFFSQ